MSAFRSRRGSTRTDRPKIPDELTETKSYTSQLEILNRILTVTRGPYEVPELLELLVKEIVDAVGVRWGTIKLRSEELEDVAMTMVRQASLTAGTVPRTFENTAFFLVMGTGEKVVVDDLSSDDRFPSPSKETEAARTLLAVPIQHKGVLIGVLTLVDRLDGRPFSKNSQALTALLAAEAGSIIHGARLMEDALEHRAQEQERIMARKVWQRFLPEALPQVEGFDLAATCRPARYIGGDYYDAIRLTGGRTLLALGDVSGSGMAAALLMSNLQAGLRIGLRSRRKLAGATRLLNEHLCTTTDSDRFATLFIGALDPENRRMEYVNAGHNPPIILHADGSYDLLDSTGIPLGFITDAAYEAAETSFNCGDRIILYSDGVTEAEAKSGEQFEIDRVAASVRESYEEPAEMIMYRILEAVEAWISGAETDLDDCTIIVAKCMGEEGS
jgi:serine phosphatase RsbU (regulator of sigma subunit)